jgi:hypothetical protein
MLLVKVIINLVAGGGTTASVSGKGRSIGSLGRWYGLQSLSTVPRKSYRCHHGVMESNPEKAVLNYLSSSLTKCGNVCDY